MEPVQTFVETAVRAGVGADLWFSRFGSPLSCFASFSADYRAHRSQKIIGLKNNESRDTVGEGEVSKLTWSNTLVER